MRQPRLLDWSKRHWPWLALIAIMVIAAVYRFYHLSQLPPGLHPDEAANGLDVFRILEKHDWRPLYNTNGPREALFFYFQAIFVATIGNTILALRLAPAIIGTLSVGAVFLWARSWFGHRIGLLAAFLMAVTPWAVTFSRDGFRASQMMLFVPLVLWLFTVAIRRKRLVWFLIAGVVLGLGFYTYLAFRLLPVGLVVIGLFYSWRHKRFLGKSIRPLLVSLAAAWVVLIPLIIYGFLHPGDISGRASGTSFLNHDLNHGRPVATLAASTVKTALMFNLHGDDNYRHNLGGQPMLNVFVGLMFLFGILICLSRLTRPAYLALPVLLATMLLPAILTAEGLPHALRSIGALPIALVLAAVGISTMIDWWQATFPINSAARASAWGAIAVLLALTAWQGWRQYFVAWAQAPETYRAFSEDAVAVARFLNQNQFSGQRYAVIDGYSDKTVEYLTHRHSDYRRLDPPEINNLVLDGQPKQFVIVAAQKAAALEPLKAKFAGGSLRPEFSLVSSSELFDVYEITK